MEMEKDWEKYLDDKQIRKAIAVYCLNNSNSGIARRNQIRIVSEKAGVTAFTASAWLSPDSEIAPSMEAIKRISDQSGISIEYMLQKTFASDDAYGILERSRRAKDYRKNTIQGKELIQGTVPEDILGTENEDGASSANRTITDTGKTSVDNPAVKAVKEEKENNKPSAKPSKVKIPGFLKEVSKIILSIAVVLGVFVLFFTILRHVKDTGQLSLDITDVSCIHSMKAAGIHANLVDDHQSVDQAVLRFEHDVLLFSDYELQALDKEGNWQDVDTIEISMVDGPGELRIEDYPVRMDYELKTGTARGKDGYPLFNSQMTYEKKTKDDYTYHVMAPVMDCYLYFPADEREYLEVSVDHSEMVMYRENTPIGICSSFRVPAYQYYDRVFEENLMECTLFFEQIEETNAGIHFVLAPYLKAIRDYGTPIRVTYLKELDMDCTGSMVWRYGDSVEESLHNDRVSFVVDENKIKATIDSVKSDGAMYFTQPEGDEEYGSVTFSTQEYHYPDTEFEVIVDNNKRETKLMLDKTVTELSLDLMDQFPNFITYLIKNWSTAVILTIVLYIVGKLAFFRKKEN